MSMFKPMLAGVAPEDLSSLKYPVLASPKLDGIRCLIRNGEALSRSLKPIPNDFVREQLTRTGRPVPDGIDGELMVEGGFSACQSAIMSREGEPEFFFFAFDWHLSGPVDIGYQARLQMLNEWAEAEGNFRTHVVEHVLIHNAKDLLAYEHAQLLQGFEGVMIRDPMGLYKYGRSTTKEGGLLKLKRFEDAEAVVIGAVERYHNENEQTRDELGLAKRSGSMEGKRPAGDLGALVCKLPSGVEFEIGSGFTADQRRDLWQGFITRRTYPAGAPKPVNFPVGATVKFKHQPDPSGGHVKPRCPVFLGFRHSDDQ